MSSLMIVGAAAGWSLIADVAQNDKIDLSVTAQNSAANMAFTMRVQP